MVWDNGPGLGAADRRLWAKRWAGTRNRAGGCPDRDERANAIPAIGGDR